MKSPGASTQVEICPLANFVTTLAYAGGMLASCFASSPLMAEELPEALWLTDDHGIVVATGPCKAGSKTLCGIIAGLPDAVTDRNLAEHKNALCGLPLLWDLVWDPARQTWINGKVLDPSTEEVFNLSATTLGETMKLRVWAGNQWLATDMVWQKIQTLEEPCSIPE